MQEQIWGRPYLRVAQTCQYKYSSTHKNLHTTYLTQSLQYNQPLPHTPFPKADIDYWYN